MLTLLLGTDWIANRQEILKRISKEVGDKKASVLIVPELISHDTERRLCQAAGDTSSRYAEVLTFTRLARRVSDAAGHGARECLDAGGRLVAMAAAARQLRGKLKAYAAVETKPEFLTGLVDAVDEFKRCCISTEDLRRAASETEGAFAQKLEELSLLLEAYDALCAQGKRDPRDQMNWVLEQLEDSSFAEDHVFYIDGFPDFTRQHMAILQYLISASSHVVVSLTCDVPNSDKLAFEKAGQTAAQFLSAAEKAGAAVEIRNVTGRQNPISEVYSRLFQGKLEKTEKAEEYLKVYRADSIHQECGAAAEYILSLVRNGARYRDISVVCTDMGIYHNILPSVFRRCKIPVYLSGTEDVLEKPVMITVLSALDAALGGFEQRAVLEYLKSMLSPLTLSVCDAVENYAIMWNISGTKWTQEWKKHPGGLGEEWTEESRTQLEKLNAAREIAVMPLKHLLDHFRIAGKLSEQVDALSEFLEEIHLAERLSQLAEQMDSEGDNRNAQILNQLWEILLGALEQLSDVLGESVWDGDSFARLLRLLLSQYDVGTIPPVLDTITAGPVSAMRCQQVRHLLILGAMEGSLPGYAGSAGILSDRERVALRSLGVPLTGGAVEGLQAEFAEIYGVFCGAQDTIALFCPAGQPSFVYNRMLALCGKEVWTENVLGPICADSSAAAAFLVREGAEKDARILCVQEEYRKLKDRCAYSIGTVSRPCIEKLYGKKLRLSASQIDKQADCRMSYFLKYGMRAKERKPITVDPAEFGTYVHSVLESTGRDVLKRGGFRKVSLEEIQKIAASHSDAYAKERFTEIDSRRLSYLFRRNTKELAMVVEELWQEMQVCKFQPVDFEVGFGEKELMESIPIPGNAMSAELRGYVDRVDMWKTDKQNYYRVVDYKTGKKDFDYCDVYNGLGLQMLLYLFALEQAGTALLGDHPVPAGVQYFPARVPYVSANGVISPEEAEQERIKFWKRKGLLLQDMQVLEAMEPGENPVRLCYKIKKDGSISGDLADREQFQKLKAFIMHVLQKMVDDIASGSVEPNPYTRGSSHNACTFCPYGAVCHPEEVEGRRNYQMMTHDKFWEEVDKEMKKNGR